MVFSVNEASSLKIIPVLNAFNCIQLKKQQRYLMIESQSNLDWKGLQKSLSPNHCSEQGQLNKDG